MNRHIKIAISILFCSATLQASLLTDYLDYKKILAQKSALSQKMQQSSFNEGVFKAARLSIDVEEFRDFSKRYALRMYLNDPRQVKLEQAYFNYRKAYFQRMQKAAADTILAKRYLQLFEAARQKRLLQLLHKKRTIETEYLQYLLANMTESGTQAALQDARAKLTKTDDRYALTVSLYRDRLFAIAAAMPEYNLLQIDDAIDAFVRKNVKPPLRRIASLRLLYDPKKDPLLLDKEERIMQQRFALEKAETGLKPMIDNIDFQYRQSEPLKSGLRAGISFRIPLTSKSSTLLEKEIALKKAETAQKEARSEGDLKNRTAQERILQNISRYRRLQQRMPDLSQKVDIADEAQIRSFVKAKEWQLTLQEKMTDIQLQIATDLLQLLYRSGELNKKGANFWQL